MLNQLPKRHIISVTHLELPSKAALHVNNQLTDLLVKKC